MHSKWLLKDTPSKEQIDEMVQETGATRLVAAVLCVRNFSCGQAKAFLSKDASALHNPFLFQDMEKAVLRIKKAISEKEHITVYGDYDADGITASALLVDCLKSLSANVDFYIPERETEGYGMSKSAVETVFARGTKLIISVDCGITATEECEYAKNLGVDVIITDHHECGEQIPDALAVINPKVPGSDYPDKNLAGVGVALKLCQALCMEQKSIEETAFTYAELVSLGTIADIAPLTGENRVLCDMGLKKIPNSENCGFQALVAVSDLIGKPLDATKVGFQLAPKINAVGRLSDAALAVELFLSDDREKTRETAEMLAECNVKRQKIEQEILEEAEQMVEKCYKDDSVLVLSNENWHHGVVGIVASRLTKKYNKPCILISPGADGFYKGSGRSLEGFSLYDALHYSADTLERFGGHELAAGLVIDPAKVDAFRKKINDRANEVLKGEQLLPVVEADLELRGRHLNMETATSLLSLEPFGTGNKAPIFMIRNMTVNRISALGANGQHLKMQLEKDGFTVDAIAFSFADKIHLSYGSEVTVMANLDINSFRGTDSVQLKIIDMK